MTNASEMEGIFIRSMATRGSLGGLSRATFDTIQILDSAGFDIILIETVGVGQAEVDIIRAADSCIVVLVPGMGDSVQAFKAGVLEIADVYVINKADRDGADLLERDLLTLLSIGEEPVGGWKPPVVRTIATKGEGADKIIEQLATHHQWLNSSEQGKERRKRILEHTILRVACDLVVTGPALRHPEKVKALVEQCFRRELDPHSAAETLLKETA
jgi:LAO/AO transport system kinase